MNSNSYGSPGTTGGNKEWLDDKLTILEPEETPFTSLVPKDNNAKATFHEVVSDRLRAPRTSGTREGESGTKGGNKAVKRARFGAYVHRFMDTFGVTDVQQAVSEAGGVAVTDDEYADAKAKCLREVKRDMEATLCSNNDTQGGTADDEMKLRGAFKWLASTQTPAVPADFLTPAAQRLTSVATLIETGASSLNSVLKSLKGQYGGSRTYHMLAGNDYIEDIDLFTRTGDGGTTANRYRVQESGSEREITMMVRVFESSFGRLEVHPSDFLQIDSSGVGDVDSALILNLDLWKLSFLERLHAVDDTEDAGGMSGYVKAIGGLFCTMPRGNASIQN
jgi:hypothetical protein